MPEQKSLADQIDTQIRATGPISLATYMRLCLTHPTLGYYRNADPLGAAGDFVTAPEISQMFGEFIGLWIANCWQALSRPASFTLLELGPGRGTLLDDALRVLANVDGFTTAMRLTLLETNPTLKQLQRRRLGPYEPKWIGEIDELDDKDGPLIVIANEFFDALPIRQYQKYEGNWHERAIGLRDGKRGWGLAPTPLPPQHLPAAIRDAEDGAVWESGFAAAETMAALAKRIAARGGALLTIDYGYPGTRTGDTFQAVARHQHVDPLENPGTADLTAHVDFEALATAATDAGAVAHPLLTQAEFLDILGIEARADALAKANPNLAGDIGTAKARLVGQDQMGSLFKVLCISSKDFTPYPFDPASLQGAT